MENIKSFEEWESIQKNKSGKKEIDGQTIEDKNGLLDRTVKRLIDTNVDKVCGGIKKLEDDFGDNKDIHILYEPNDENPPQKLKDIIEKESNGFVKLEDIFPGKGEEIINLFKQAGNDINIGKGEVLLSCMFPDVRMKNRDNKEKGDCAIVDDKENIRYHIEVKSAGAGFEDVKAKENDDEYNYAYSIASHIYSRYTNDDIPTIFLFFDNTINNRKGQNDPTGFFWINCGELKSKDKKGTKEFLTDLLKQHIKIGNPNTKSNQTHFSISCVIPKENDKKEEKIPEIIIHPRAD